MVDVSISLMKTRRLVIAANVMYAIVLLTLGLMPDVPQLVPGIPDRLAHTAAYAIQSALLFALLLSSTGRGTAAILSAVGAVVFGGIVETLQLLQPARTVELRDLVANTVGAVTAAAILYAVTGAFASDAKE